jgi:hypothetical protein
MGETVRSLDLLREQTRSHKDLDSIVQVDEVVRMRDLPANRGGYGLKELWSEKSWGLASDEVEIPTPFVLQDWEGREVDVHRMRHDKHGIGIPAWSNDGLIFKKEELAPEGFVSGFPVSCISSEMLVVCHLGYGLPDKQLRDLELLQERFGD